MMDFLMGNEQYPNQADYMQIIKPEDVDDTVTYEGAVVFHFRYVRKASETSNDVNGLKAVKKSIFIRTKDSLPFDKKDRVMLRDKIYEIESVSKVENDLFAKSRILFEHYDDYETEIELS